MERFHLKKLIDRKLQNSISLDNQRDSQLCSDQMIAEA